MKANELRIGNYVFDINGNVTHVESVISYGINLRAGDGNGIYPDDEIEFLKPIPLSEEWLDHLKDVEVNNSGTICSRGSSIFIGNGNATYDSMFKIDIQYVHELQNLYFCLTGEELPLTTN